LKQSDGALQANSPAKYRQLLHFLAGPVRRAAQFSGNRLLSVRAG
jgi:hypothetical protein